MMSPGKRKREAAAPKKKRTWFPKQITKAEYKRRHALHVERQRRMGIADEDMEITTADGKFSNRL